MDQASLLLAELADLVTLTVLSAQEMSITALAVSQDFRLILRPGSVCLRLSVPMVRSSLVELAVRFVTPITTSMRVLACTEDVSKAMLPMLSEGV